MPPASGLAAQHGSVDQVSPLESGRRLALVVATARYEDPALQQLRSPVADAERLAALLERPDIAGFEVRKVLDQPAQVISKELQHFLSNRGRGDLLLLYFSCHGLKDVDGSLYFAGSDTELAFLAATGVSATYVNERVNACRSTRIVILLDCCYSGAFTKFATKGDLSIGVQERLQGTGRVVMTASNSMEYAFEGKSLSLDAAEPSLFTSTILEGLRTGDADRDNDGRISVDELYDYVFENVRKVTPHQTPGLFASLSGTLFLARRPGGPVDLEPAPPDERGQPVAGEAASTDRVGRRLRHAGRFGRPGWLGNPGASWRPRRPLRRRLVAGIAAVVLAASVAVGLTVLHLRASAPSTLASGSSWARIADLPQALEAPAVATFRDRLFVIGGVSPEQGRGPLSTVQIYDPDTGRWSIGPSLPVAVNHAAAVATRSSIYVIGGFRSGGSTSAVYRLDSPDGQWQQEHYLPDARGGGAAAFDGERIVFAGGVAADGSARADVWTMVPGQSWVKQGVLQPAREKLTASTDGYGRVWFMGGRDIRAAKGEATYGDVDIVTKTEVQHLGQVLPPLSAPAGVQLPGFGMCVVGGQHADGTFNGTFECVDKQSGPPPPDLPRPRAGLGVAVLRQKVFAVAGYYPGVNGTALAQTYTPPAL